MIVDYVDVQWRPRGTVISVGHSGGSAYVELVSADNFALLQSDADYVCASSRQLSNGRFVETLPADDHWYVIALGDGYLDVELMVGRVPAPGAVGTGGQFTVPFDPSARHHPTVNVDLPVVGPTASTPAVSPSGESGWQALLFPQMGMDNKRLDFLRQNFFLDTVYPTSVNTGRNAVGTVITAHMSDGSTLEQWIADTNPIPQGRMGSQLVLSPDQRIGMTRVRNSPLFGDAKLLENGTIEPEDPWYVDLLDALDMASWAALIVPVADLAGLAGKAMIAAAKRAMAHVLEWKLKKGVKGAAIKAAVENAAKTTVVGKGTIIRLTIDEVMTNPKLLAGETPEQVEAALGKIPGWKVETLGKGSRAGQGWVFRQYTENGNPTGLQIRWHPGGGHHGPEPYWRVVGPNGDLGGIIR